jgi:hypothetical protein
MGSARPIFSADSQHVGYIALVSVQQQRLVVDGVEGALYTKVRTASLFSADGKRTAYAANAGKTEMAVIDTVAGKSYPQVSAPIFTADGKDYAYVAYRDNDALVVRDGHEWQPYPDILARSLCFSPDSRSLAYIAEEKGLARVVVNGKAGNGYSAILEDSFRFSPDSARFCYAAKKNQQVVVVDDKAEVVNGTLEDVPIFSPDSRQVAYVAYAPNADRLLQGRVVMNGTAGAPYDYINVDSLHFSPDSTHCAYLATRGEQHFVVNNGVEGASYDSIESNSLVFSPDSAHLAYYAKKAKQWYVVVDGIESAPLADGMLTRSSLLFDSATTLHGLVGRDTTVSVLGVSF